MITVTFKGEITIDSSIEEFIESFQYNHTTLYDYIKNEYGNTLYGDIRIDKIENEEK